MSVSQFLFCPLINAICPTRNLPNYQQFYRETTPLTKYNVCLEKGSDDIGSAVCVTNSWSDFPFEAHIEEVFLFVIL